MGSGDDRRERGAFNRLKNLERADIARAALRTPQVALICAAALWWNYLNV